MVSYPFLQFMDPVPDVLILVVMEDGLVLIDLILKFFLLSLNPCCNGRWSRTLIATLREIPDVAS